jgi:hypothetical protein
MQLLVRAPHLVYDHALPLPPLLDLALLLLRASYVLVASEGRRGARRAAVVVVVSPSSVVAPLAVGDAKFTS